MSPTPEIETRIAQIKTQLEGLSSALLHNDPISLEGTTSALKTLSVELSNLVQTQLLNAAENNLGGQAKSLLHQRIKEIVAQIALNRDGLARRSASVDRALHTLVPATQISTYAGAGGRYGSHTARTGAFKTLAA